MKYGIYQLQSISMEYDLLITSAGGKEQTFLDYFIYNILCRHNPRSLIHIIISNLNSNLASYGTLIPIYRWENWGSERFSNRAKIAYLVSDETESSLCGLPPTSCSLFKNVLQFMSAQCTNYYHFNTIIKTEKTAYSTYQTGIHHLLLKGFWNTSLESLKH